MGREYFFRLIAQGEVGKCIEQLVAYAKSVNKIELYEDLISISGRYHRTENAGHRNIIYAQDYQIEINKISDALRYYIRKWIGEDEEINLDISEPVTAATVFISYSTSNNLIAERVDNYLSENNFEVIIDSKDAKPQQSLNEFINESIKLAEVTFLVVSTDSLLSGWVVKEIILALSAEEFSDKKFIAGYIDSAFLDVDFVGIALDEIEEEIIYLQRLIDKRNARNRNFDDLFDDLTRKKDLHHNLPRIVRKLRESYTVNISEGHFEEGMQRITDYISE